MKILFVDSQYPMFDRASADVRMFAIVRLLREQAHSCHYFVTDIGAAESRLGEKEVTRYRDAIRGLGVETIERTSFEQTLANWRYDTVYFKYFYPAEVRIPLVRIWQPHARVVVDSVDLVYARLLAKAEVSGLAEDRQEAEGIRKRELATYSSADLVITVTEDEARVPSLDIPNLSVHVIPNIHELPLQPRSESPLPSLLFIGTFTHEPNVDGVLWFANEVWPAVRTSFPETRFRVIGGSPPPEVTALAQEDGIDVMGYVPDTLPYLMEAWVSVAPLRFGAGMKGKVGEAMAAGIPVVTTRFGAEGFGLTPGKHLLVANSPSDTIEAVISLLHNADLRRSIGVSGRDFIIQNYTRYAVGKRIASVVKVIRSLPRKPATLSSRIHRIRQSLFLAFGRHFEWRLRSQKIKKM